jgi:thioredoxin-dependent peroxiredoxin
MIQEGSSAPELELTDGSGRTVRLSDFRGSPVVLYFYPKDDTPGCTRQACELRDSYAEFRERGAVILGVSPDDEASHMRFREKFDLPFPLLADTGWAAAKTFDVVGEASFDGGPPKPSIRRSTFVIAADGTVLRAMYDVAPDGHADAVLDALPS